MKSAKHYELLGQWVPGFMMEGKGTAEPGSRTDENGQESSPLDSIFLGTFSLFLSLSSFSETSFVDFSSSLSEGQLMCK